MSKRSNYKHVECADCGGEALAPNKFTRYCSTCRLARGVLWHDLRSTDCPTCDREYVAWTGTHSDRSCGHCFMERATEGGRESVPGTCAFCKRDAWVFSKHIPVCYPCLYDPSLARKMKASIVPKYRELTARQN